MKKRKFLKILGGGAILAATGVGYRVTREPDRALAPWKLASFSGQDVIRNALSFAILAPNPHNRQPWIVDLDTPGAMSLYVDNDRLLPHTDPFSRQITIGLGCFCELFVLALQEQGFSAELQFFPEGEDIYSDSSKPVVVARIREDNTATADPLFQQVMARRSNKEPYDVARQVQPQMIDRIAGQVKFSRFGGSVRDSDIAELRQITEAALEIEIETPLAYKESVDLFRIGHQEIEQNPDGIDFSGPLFESLSLAGMFTREMALDTTSSTYQQGRDAVLLSTATAMGHIWVVSPGNTRLDQINAGRDWLRINLATTRLGMATQPLSQALQEYPEMAEIYRTIHQRLSPEGGTVQMLARIGYGANLKPSPRWPIESKIKSMKT